MDHDLLTSLPPGFRFQPNDDEVHYYLKHWVSGEPLKPIDVVDVYKFEPWDLPSKSTLKMGDRECYFFSVLGRKYGKSSRINRTTEKGFWKPTGKDREVRRNSRTVMMKKKILTFYTGRAGHGDPTNWVMHEYRLVEKEFERDGISLDSLVLCKVFQKGGTELKTEEASFGEETATEEVAVGDGEYGISQGSWNMGYPSETSELHHDQNFIDILEEHGMDANSFRDDELYIEAKDLSIPIKVDPADLHMADDFLNLDYDLPDMNFDSIGGFDPSELLGTENASSPVTLKNEIGEADQVSRLSNLQGRNDASSSKNNPKALTDESGYFAG